MLINNKIRGLKFVGNKILNVTEEMYLEESKSREVASIMTSKGPDMVFITTPKQSIIKEVNGNGVRIYMCSCCGKIVRKEYKRQYRR